jgi:phosphoribosylaminoimidazole-succinocarboxamide synthase
MDQSTLRQTIPEALTGLDLAWPHERAHGKVRDLFSLPDGRWLIATTDRLSAFDRVLTAIPFKGQVLNQLSAFWFENTNDIVPNHILEVPDPNVSLVHACEPLPVEVVVRGYISGSTKTSLWYRYERGERHMYGYDFDEGMIKNEQLPEPIITPTTKGRAGEHDEPITCEQIVQRGLLDGETWGQVQTAALAIFGRGQEIAREGNLILVDTKYEFGRTPDGSLVLIDEVHTPDSSRFWLAGSYEDRMSKGLEPENFDKEFLRLWYAEKGYRGSGEPPEATEDLIVQVAQRYIALYEKLTGQVFEPASYPAGPRIEQVLSGYL